MKDSRHSSLKAGPSPQGLFRFIGRLICKAAFRMTDANKNSKLEDIEIEIAILRM